MKLKTTLIGFLLLGLFSCSDNGSDFNSLSNSELNGTWKVISFEDLNVGTIEFKTQENSWDRDIVVTFDNTKNPNEISGTNITNSIFGDFDYVGQRQFKMNSLGSTYVSQPEWADKFIEAISDNVVTFEVNSKRLRIYYHNKTKRITLVKV